VATTKVEGVQAPVKVNPVESTPVIVKVARGPPAPVITPGIVSVWPITGTAEVVPAERDTVVELAPADSAVLAPPFKSAVPRWAVCAVPATAELVVPFPTRTVSPVVPGERYCGLRLLAALALAAEYGIVKLATNEPRAFAAGAPPIAGTAPPIAGAADKAGEPAPLPPPQPAAASIPVNATPVRILGVIESFLSLVI
jgi:hypothetical protein